MARLQDKLVVKLQSDNNVYHNIVQVSYYCGQLTRMANVTHFTQLHKTRGFSSELPDVATQCCQGKCHENIDKNCGHVRERQIVKFFFLKSDVIWNEIGLRRRLQLCLFRRC